MRLRWILAFAAVPAVLLVAACERRILPDAYYEPPKPQEQVERETRQAEDAALEALPKVPTIGERRTWTTPAGDSSVEGAMISLDDDYVEILLKNGTTKAIPLDRLSQADQQYARETARAAGGKQPAAGNEP